jgi:hypothetical protein
VSVPSGGTAGSPDRLRPPPQQGPSKHWRRCSRFAATRGTMRR